MTSQKDALFEAKGTNGSIREFCVLPVCFPTCMCSYNGPSYLDPLSYALDRGSEALRFINSPLVLDYVHVKFSCRYDLYPPIVLHDGRE